MTKEERYKKLDELMGQYNNSKDPQIKNRALRIIRKHYNDLLIWTKTPKANTIKRQVKTSRLPNHLSEEVGKSSVGKRREYAKYTSEQLSKLHGNLKASLKAIEEELLRRKRPQVGRRPNCIWCIACSESAASRRYRAGRKDYCPDFRGREKEKEPRKWQPPPTGYRTTMINTKRKTFGKL